MRIKIALQAPQMQLQDRTEPVPGIQLVSTNYSFYYSYGANIWITEMGKIRKCSHNSCKCFLEVYIHCGDSVIV